MLITEQRVGRKTFSKKGKRIKDGISMISSENGMYTELLSLSF